MLDLGHLGNQIGGLDQPRRGSASGDHHMLMAGTRQQDIYHIIDVHPAPLQWVGELVEYVEVVALCCQPTRDLGPAVRCRRGVIEITASLA